MKALHDHINIHIHRHIQYSRCTYICAMCGVYESHNNKNSRKVVALLTVDPSCDRNKTLALQSES